MTSARKKMATIQNEQELRDAVINHEAAISSLGGRIQGVEDGLKTVHADIASVKSDMGVGFNAVMSEIRQNKAELGPRFGDLLKYIAIGGGLVGMSAAAITVLVTSFVAPDITALKTHSTSYQRDFDARIDEARQELTAFRNKERERLRDEIDSLRGDLVGIREKIGWLGKVEAKR